MKAWIPVLLIAGLMALGLAVPGSSPVSACSQRASCEQASCGQGLRCPGNCGCVKRQGQPFGRCVSY